MNRLIGWLLGVMIRLLESYDSGHMGSKQPRTEWPLAQRNLASVGYQRYVDTKESPWYSETVEEYKTLLESGDYIL